MRAVKCMKQLSQVSWAVIAVGLAAPLSASAQGIDLKGAVDVFIAFIGGVLIPLALAILFLVFVANIAAFIHAGNSGKKDMADLAKKRLLIPIAVMFFVFTLWAILTFLRLFFTA